MRSITIVRRGVFPGWAQVVPYAVVVVSPVEFPGVRYFSNIYGVDGEALEIGMKVTADFLATHGGQSILGFRALL